MLPPVKLISPCVTSDLMTLPAPPPVKLISPEHYRIIVLVRCYAQLDCFRETLDLFCINVLKYF